MSQIESVQRTLAKMIEPLVRVQREVLDQFVSLTATQGWANFQMPAVEQAVRVSEQVSRHFAPILAAQASWAEQFRIQIPNLDVLTGAIPRINLDAIADVMRAWADALPPNWSDDVDFDRLHVAVYEHGLPIVWVPRAPILDAVLAAETREARLTVLRASQAQVLEDCDRVLHEVTHARLANQVPLALAAVRALEQGHPEAAQALAVTVADTTIRDFLHAKYAKAREMVEADIDEVAVMQVRTVLALAPIHLFFTDYWPGEDKPLPVALSRHVTIHMATAEHVNPDNALVAVMLVSSLLRTFHEMAAVAGHDGSVRSSL